MTGATHVQHNYLILHGSRDGDVFNFPGYKTYDRSHSVDLNRPTEPASGFKSLLWIHGANHNFFNSVWQQESQNTITREQQEQIAKVYISAIAQALLLDKSQFADSRGSASTYQKLDKVPKVGEYPILKSSKVEEPWRTLTV